MKLVDELPRRRERRGYERVVLYVPTKFKDGNKLAPIIGEDMARKMVAQFGGELIFLAHAKSLRAQQRLDAIANAVRGGMTREGVARVFGVSHSTVKRALRTSVAIPAPVIAFDHAPNTNTAH
ncbi:TPA: Mor transcription activator family protein [Stenotrophomonas maltophilia]